MRFDFTKRGMSVSISLSVFAPLAVLINAFLAYSFTVCWILATADNAVQ